MMHQHLLQAPGHLADAISAVYLCRYVRRPSSSRRRSGSPTIRRAPHVIFRPDAGRRYIAFNKPYGVLSQFTQPEESARETLALFGFPPDVYPIGRLDYDSEGLLLLSDDPGLNARLLDPKHGHPRIYLAQVEGIPAPDALRRLESGVIVAGHRTLPARAELLADDPGLPPRPVPIRHRRSIPTSWLRLELTEGKNRQVRRMTAAVGHPTLRLVRVAIGRLHLDTLALRPGEWRMLTHEQLRLALQHAPGNVVSRPQGRTAGTRRRRRP